MADAKKTEKAAPPLAIVPKPASLDDVVALMIQDREERRREYALQRELVRLLMDQKRHRRARQEVATFAVDEALQLVSSDPWKRLGRLGLRVPFLATSAANPADPTGLSSRYSFVLDSIEIAEQQTIRLRGAVPTWALVADLGATVEEERHPYLNFMTVDDPMFRLRDGNVSWSLTFVGFGEAPASIIPFASSFLAAPPPGSPTASPCSNLAYLYAQNPALLFAKPGTGTIFPAANVDPVTGKPDFYTSLSGYMPPSKGRPYGAALRGGFPTRYDTWANWNSARAWDSLDIEVEGPGVLLFSCSVRQNDPSTNTPPSGLPDLKAYYSGGDSHAQQFVWNYPTTARIGAVAGRLIWEDIS